MIQNGIMWQVQVSGKSLRQGKATLPHMQSTLDSADKQNKTKSAQFSKQPITQWIDNCTCGLLTLPASLYKSLTISYNTDKHGRLL